MYPSYRKITNRDTWYKIVSDTEFHEVSRLGNRLIVEVVVAVQFPEKLKIQDMLECKGEHYEKVSGQEFDDFVKN